MPPPDATPPDHCGGARAEDFRAALEGAVARILEAHRCEVAELEARLHASSPEPPGDLCRQPPPPGHCPGFPPPEVYVPVQQPAVISSVFEGSAPGPNEVKPQEPKHGWVGPSNGGGGLVGSSSLVPSLAAAVTKPAASSSIIGHVGGTQWQWKHRDGWKNYDQAVSDKIEETFQRGHPKVRLKAGKKSSSPMEIFFADMVQHDASTGNTRDVRRVGPERWWMGVKRHVLSYYYAWDTGLPRTDTLENAKARKRRIEMDGVCSVFIPRDPVLSMYKSSGFSAAVVKNSLFQGFATALVALNTIWIAIDLDNNDGPRPNIGFQVVDHAFCALFSVEIAFRFAAYKKKKLCLKDAWFCFDAMTVLPSVVDNWLLPLAGALAGQERSGLFSSDLTVLRVVRLLRLTRMYRLIKSMPTMMTLLRGISTSIRPVSIAVCLLLIMIYRTSSASCSGAWLILVVSSRGSISRP
ncbi:unnamed protein product [Prorocentrum cordatum]|uniref:WWE domain-containing protein n=1 Tax=Prorocentrum cordatum TaxID=2364126 RepID=A0ABN9T067_9DINO|nr:unnamed protein product [Polarella glacialis]